MHYMHLGNLQRTAKVGFTGCVALLHYSLLFFVFLPLPEMVYSCCRVAVLRSSIGISDRTSKQTNIRVEADFRAVGSNQIGAIMMKTK